MVKIPPHKVEKELKKQQEEFDEPDEAEIGKDVGEDLKRVIGNEPQGTLAEEVEKDEEAIKEGADTPGYPPDEDEEAEE
jgi:hypothetical protein